jgi:hypothetical protein
MPARRETPAAGTRRHASAHPAAAILTEHDIASRAYELFLQRGGEHGRDWDDWLCAERELRAAPRRSSTPPTASAGAIATQSRSRKRPEKSASA